MYRVGTLQVRGMYSWAAHKTLWSACSLSESTFLREGFYWKQIGTLHTITWMLRHLVWLTDFTFTYNDWASLFCLILKQNKFEPWLGWLYVWLQNQVLSLVVTQDFDLSSADSTSSQGNVSRMSIDREFLAMEIDEVKDHRYSSR